MTTCQATSLIPVETGGDILPQWRGTPIADLLAFHNLGEPFRSYTQAELAVAMCMDNRKALRIPDNFAYILRTGGGNTSGIEFEISFAIAVKGIRALALVAHNDCGMVALSAQRETFVDGLSEVGWTRAEAEAHFDKHVPTYEITDPIQSVLTQTARIQARYPSVTVSPLFYSNEEKRFYQIPV